MKQQLRGIGLILFGVLLCAANLSLKAGGYDFYFLNFLPPPGLIAICFGVVGMVFLFGRSEEE